MTWFLLLLFCDIRVVLVFLQSVGMPERTFLESACMPEKSLSSTFVYMPKRTIMQSVCMHARETETE